MNLPYSDSRSGGTTHKATAANGGNYTSRNASWISTIRTPLQRMYRRVGNFRALSAATNDRTIAAPESQTVSTPPNVKQSAPYRPTAGNITPLATFQRVVGAPAPAATTAAAVAATLAASERSSKNTRVSPNYRPFLDAWDKGYDFNAREEPWGTWLQVTTGQLPPELRGTFFRNGPGRFSRGPDVHGHPHDGDGLVASVAFPGDGRAFFRSAFVRTLEHEAEDVAGRLLFRGALSSRGRGGLLGNAGNLALRNAANTGVALQGDKLLALYPGGLPYALDPATLVTRGSDLLGGVLAPGVPLSLGSPAADQAVGRLNRMLGFNDRLPSTHTALGGHACSARPRICGTTGRRVFWSHRTLLAGMPVEAAAASMEAGADGSREGNRNWELRGIEMEGNAQGGRPMSTQVQDAGPKGFDMVAWIGASMRWLRRPPHERFVTEITFWEMEPSDDLNLDLDSAPAQQLQPFEGGLPQRDQEREQQPVRRRGLCYKLPGFAAPLHDVAITPNYYLVLQPPVHPEILPYVLGESGPVSCLRWREDEAAILHIIPRPGSEAERRGEQPVHLPVLPAVCILHHVNAFEDRLQPGRLVLDSVVYDTLPALGAQPLPEQVVRAVDPDAGCKPRLQRLIVDLPSGTISRRPVPGDPLPTLDAAAGGPSRHLELPTINNAYTGRRYRYVYGCSVLFEDASCGVIKGDMETQQVQRWTPGPGYICLEPCFVPRLPTDMGPGSVGKAVGRLPRYRPQYPMDAAPPPAVAKRQLTEDDGWLLVYGFDSVSRHSELLVFDAWAIMAGPVARLALPSPLPHGLYGTWTDEYFGPQQ